MLWYKSWLETRWRFLTGLGILVVLACGTVVDYPAIARLLPFARAVDTGTTLGRAINNAMEIERDFRGFVWWEWFRQNLAQTWTLFAILLGSGGLLSRCAGDGTLFTLSLPASRNELIRVRAATGLAELVVLALIPSLFIPLLAPSIGQQYGVGDVLIHGVCLFVAGAVFFCLALLLSTVFAGTWRPLLIACIIAFVVAVCEPFVPGASRFGIFGAMAGAVYFRTGGLPWLPLVASAAASALLLYGATINFARQDF